MYAKRLFFQGLFLVNLGIILFYWFATATGSFSDLTGWFVAFGRLAGLFAAASLLLQFSLIGRLTWLEGAFGLDHLSRIHHTFGRNALWFLILHPVLIVWGYSRAAGVHYGAQLKELLLYYPYVWLAAIGLLLLVIVVGTSIHITRSRLRYELWYFVHLLAYGGVFFSFWHQINLGTTITHRTAFYWYWVALYLLVFGNFIFFRFIRPLRFYFRHRFYVDRIERETDEVVSIYIKGQRLLDFPAKAGQFMFMRFLTPDRFWQAHPFSVSQVPNGKELRITVKQLGDFTNNLSMLQPRTRVFIDGPYGIFTEDVNAEEKVLLIAGGIGITPIRSLMERLLQKGRDVMLLYGNKRETDIVFKRELEELTRQYPARLVYVLSDEATYEGEQGHIDREKLERLVSDITTRDVYVCGPKPMLKSVITALATLGVAGRNIHFEKFSLG